MTTLISAAVMDSKTKKKKGNAVELRGDMVQFETSLLDETSDPLSKAPPPATENQSEQNPEPARTVKPDSVSYSTAKYEQNDRPCYNGIGSDDIELRESSTFDKIGNKISGLFDSNGAGSSNGGYTKSEGEKISRNSNGSSSTPTRSPGSPGSDSSPGEEIKKRASRLSGLLKGKLASASDSLGKLVDKAKEKANKKSGSKGEYQLQKEGESTVIGPSEPSTPALMPNTTTHSASTNYSDSMLDLGGTAPVFTAKSAEAAAKKAEDGDEPTLASGGRFQKPVGKWGEM